MVSMPYELMRNDAFRRACRRAVQENVSVVEYNEWVAPDGARFSEAKVPSSLGEGNYKVTTDTTAERVLVSCTCTAGDNEKMCKHVAAVIMMQESIQEVKRGRIELDTER